MWNSPYYHPFQYPQQPVVFIPPNQQNLPPHPTTLKELKEYSKFMKKLMKEDTEERKKKEEEEKKKKDQGKKNPVSFGQALFLLTVGFPVLVPVYALFVAGSIKLSWWVLQLATQGN